MTTDQAREMLSSLAAVRSDLAGGAKELPAAAQLGLLLAVERRRGDDSFWAPYIRSLPDDVPCGWALSKQQLTATLDALRPTLGARLEGWAPAAERAGKGVEAVAEAAVKRYGRHLEGDLDVADVVWGMGQVLSRSFGGGADLGMAPYIDLLNHREGAPKPRSFVDSDDDDAGGRGFVVIDCSLHGEPQALAAGEEAFISYAAAEAGGDPLQAFLNLGFVPPELVRQRARARGP
ncbi:hypothetical protein HYH03_001083 [Edaphochlamys debaryana]|uniref:SET domain-containing protein n=1 Tax=Edaphochlamys debaryana TaxID=47281 RepID=A0A836C5J8_9CHLO|nr:hypothetical protein HYH03_001083 [Edaphochlamys debaryana]|eukprot:KAG2501281.1 hypothetical protein HYH03_001083 [Edaphochlamys debaryana]